MALFEKKTDSGCLLLTKQGQVFYHDHQIAFEINLEERVHPDCSFIIDLAFNNSSKTVYLVEKSGKLFKLNENQLRASEPLDQAEIKSVQKVWSLEEPSCVLI